MEFLETVINWLLLSGQDFERASCLRDSVPLLFRPQHIINLLQPNASSLAGNGLQILVVFPVLGLKCREVNWSTELQHVKCCSSSVIMFHFCTNS
jgi:hypothetical protein